MRLRPHRNEECKRKCTFFSRRKALTQDLLNISKARINRAQDSALLSQAMSIHQDLVNILI